MGLQKQFGLNRALGAQMTGPPWGLKPVTTEPPVQVLHKHTTCHPQEPKHVQEVKNNSPNLEFVNHISELE